MKRMLSFFTVLAVVVMFAAPSFASMDRLKSGAKEVVRSPLQVSDHIMAETKDAKFLPFALAGGLLKGAFYMGKDMIHGSYYVITSPVVK